MNEELGFLENKKIVLNYLDSVLKTIDEVREKLKQVVFIEEYKEVCSSDNSDNLSKEDKKSLELFKKFSSKNKDKPVKELSYLHNELSKSNKNKILGILDLSKNIESIDNNLESNLKQIVEEIEIFTKTIISLELLIMSIVKNTKESLWIKVFKIDEIKKISSILLLKIKKKKEKILNVHKFVEKMNNDTLDEESSVEFFDYILKWWDFTSEFIKKYNIDEIILEEELDDEKEVLTDKEKQKFQNEKENKEKKWFLSSFYSTFTYWINKPWGFSWEKSKNKVDTK